VRLCGANGKISLNGKGEVRSFRTRKLKMAMLAQPGYGIMGIELQTNRSASERQNKKAEGESDGIRTRACINDG
jgi:hypothetical protein